MAIYSGVTMAKKKSPPNVETPPILHAVPDVVPIKPPAPTLETSPRVACPVCGCGHAPIVGTNTHHGKKFYSHDCRNCGRIFRRMIPDNTVPDNS